MCYDFDARPPIPPISGAAIDGRDIVLEAADGNHFSAYIAHPAKSDGAQMLILPDVRGLHPFYKELAQRLAENGVRALALDYFGRTAGTEPRDESFEFQPHVAQMQMPTFLQDARAGLAYLREQGKSDRGVFVIGFCRGGTLGLLTGAEDLGLAGIVAFYPGMSRPVPGSKGSTLEQAGQIRFPVLGLFGGTDQSIPPSDVQQLDGQLERAHVAHELVTYPNAPHSFFDRKQTEFANESADAWKRVQEFITAHTPK